MALPPGQPGGDDDDGDGGDDDDDEEEDGEEEMEDSEDASDNETEMVVLDPDHVSCTCDFLGVLLLFVFWLCAVVFWLWFNTEVYQVTELKV